MKVLITHVYSKWNYGDAAILSANIKLVKKLFPSSNIKISSTGAGMGGSVFESTPVISSFFGHAIYSNKNKFMRTLNTMLILVETILWGMFFRFFGIRLDFLINKEIVKILNEYKSSDIIAAVGGGYITGKDNLQSDITIMFHLHTLLIGKILDKKVILFPQSIGPLGNKFQERMAAFVLNRVDLICVREKVSTETLKRIGVNKSRIINSPDLAFFHTPKKSKAVDDYFDLIFKNKKKPVIGITVREWMNPDKQAFFENEIAKFIDYLTKEYKAYVVFIPQVSVFWSNDVDEEVFKRIFGKLKDKTSVKIAKINSYKDCIYFISKLDYLIGTRMHSNIFALSNSVPSLAIAYEYKTKGIMEELGLSEWVIDIEKVSFKSLKSTFDDIFKNRTNYLEILNNNLKKYLGSIKNISESIKDLSNNQLRIVFSNYDDLKNPYYGGGGALAVYNIARRLARKYKVTVFTSKYPGSVDEIVNNINYKRIGSNISPRIDQIVYNLSLPIYAMTTHFDIWFESFTPPFSTFFLPLFTEKNVIGITHFFNAEEKSREYKLPFYLIQNVGIKFYKILIALTNENKKKIRKFNKNASVFIIPNGVEIPKKKKYKIKNYILYLGRIEINQKGIGILINAFKKIEGATNLELYIAGDGPKGQINVLKKLIAKNKLQKRVKILGRVEGKQKETLIGESKFLVIPSRFENQSLVALEAIVREKPVITFDILGFKWMPRGTRVRIPAFSVDKFASAMLVLSEDKKLYQYITDNSAKYASRFSWPKIAKKYELMIKNTL